MKKIIILELAILGIILFPVFTIADDAEQFEKPIINHLPVNNHKADLKIVTAYNLVSSQTDSTPCIGAGNHNICQALDEGKIVFAANFVPLHTICCVDTIGCGEVLDRMNKRYSDRIDYAMAADKIAEAKQFGVKKLKAYCLN